MDEDFLKEIASQLRKPSGQFGQEVAEKMNSSNRQMNIKTIEMMEISAGESILEIGMGNGAFVKKIVESADDVDYTGVDYSISMVELSVISNESYVNAGKASFIFGEINSLPIKSNSINKIFTVNTIYFWDDLRRALNECHRVLKDDGLFAIAIRPEGCMRKYPSTQFNFNYFEASDIESHFIENGFEVNASIQESEPETEVLEQMITPEFAVIVGKKV